MDFSSFSFIAVFLAGMFIFLAPCTLPLLPAYLGFLSGLTQRAIAGGITRRERLRIFANALLFVVGFTLVFSLLGLLIGSAGTLLAPLRTWLRVIGGIFVVLFGLFMLGMFAAPSLLRERRFRLPGFLKVGTPLSSLFLGAAFAVGWTPCNGPMIGSVLTYAGTSGDAWGSMLLLLVYSLGFSVPFLLLAVFFTHTTRIIERLAPVVRFVSVVGGVILVVLGIWLIFGHTWLTNWFFALLSHLDFEAALIPYL